MTTILRSSSRLSFQALRNHVALSSTGIRTSLTPELGKPHYFTDVHHDESDHHHEHDTPPTPIKHCPKTVFRQYPSFLTTNLYNSTFTKRDFWKRHYSTVAPVTEKKKVAVVLSGSGVHDGSEIQEAVSILIHLSRSGVDAKCFAPDKKQADVINHVKGTAVDESRNVLVESARIARGKVKALSLLKADEYAAIIFPGGYGAAKNLCTFAKDGDNCTVDAEVERVIKEFHAAKKPIGLCCVSPVIAAKVIPGVRVTLGNEDKDIAEAITRMGAKPESAAVTDVVIDETNSVVSTPAYMCNTSIYKVYEGIGKLVDTVLSLSKKRDETK